MTSIDTRHRAHGDPAFPSDDRAPLYLPSPIPYEPEMVQHMLLLALGILMVPILSHTRRHSRRDPH